MKKAFGFGLCVLFLVFGICLCFPSFSFPGHGEATMKLKVHKCRKLKEDIIVDGYDDNANNIDVLDYHRIDPVPSSKASIRPGPIEHGIPLMPYIPKPAPPGQAKPP